MDVLVERCSAYRQDVLDQIMGRWEAIFEKAIEPGNLVVMKPNWIAESHKYDKSEWESVITHPSVITAVLKAILRQMDGRGRVVITDGPQTQSSWKQIMSRMTPDLWTEMGKRAGVKVDIVDLRDDEWVTRRDVIVQRTRLSGDPLGSTECDLGNSSEFVGHKPGERGYFGADYNLTETRLAHSGGHHKYKVSRTVISADVFVNMPKMKTHKKAGITCSLKNLVGINTYKNWLPHHSEGTPDEGGDQFPQGGLRRKAEGALLNQFRSVLWSHQDLGKWLIPIKELGRVLFGDSRHVIRSGNWYGNQTIWRMILDLNKILLYANPDGTMRKGEAQARKRYISIVDGIIAGEGNGPEAPDRKEAGLLIAGTNPVAVDCVCAKLMGFDWRKIPSLKNAFAVRRFPICDSVYEDIRVVSSAPEFNSGIGEVSANTTYHFRPHAGWKGHIEVSDDLAAGLNEV